MFPEVFRIGSLPIYSYGLMLVISFVVGIAVAQRRARSRGLSSDAVLDVSTVILISSIVGSRILYVIFHVDEFKGRWLDTINITKGLAGLSMFGGIILAVSASFLYLHRRHIHVLKMSDAISPSIVLGVGITRIGCFLNGCCFGRPTSLPWGVTFPPGSVAWSVLGNSHIHPTQIYSSIAGFLMFGIALYIDRKVRKPGIIFLSVFIMYGISRFFVDFLRYYEANNYARILSIDLSSSQIISLFIIMGGLVGIWFIQKRPAGDSAM